MHQTVLTLNAGSSSIKFALYEAADTLNCLFSGQIEGMGTKNTILSYSDKNPERANSVSLDTTGETDTSKILLDWLEKQPGFKEMIAVGHRIVHGMKHTQFEEITPELLAELKTIAAYDPEHLPQEISLVENFLNRYPDKPQYACFDTSFHTSMPPVAKRLPIPRRLSNLGIQRYGFHGISYSYLMEELEKKTSKEMASGRIILAHLGNGASLCAVKEGKSMDTSMGFTPTAGIPMGTRSGDLDPGVAWYLMQAERKSPKEFSHLINHESGLLGMSETSSDMRELLTKRNDDPRAKEAIEVFCYQIKKYIGAYTAVLGGLDTLVFAGGIGENAPEIREEICAGLKYMEIELDPVRNKNNEEIISSTASRVQIRVIHTNEQWMIAKSVCKIRNLSIQY